LPHYPSVPAVLLGRLAVDQTMQGHGLGRYLLADAPLRAVRGGIMAYGFVVDPIDEASRHFYEREGFLPLHDAGGRL
jgi:GNAT superfamily N-acetyltransferase